MYFVAHVLPDALNEKILTYKKLMREKYGCRVGLKSPAHITLLPPFWMEGEKEDLLIRELQKTTCREPFILCTKYFSSFTPRTIFIALKENAPLNELKEKTNALFKDHPHFKIKTDARPFHPHITIATRDLHKKDYHDAWPYFQRTEFREEWMAEGVSLLKHNSLNWDVIHTSPFRRFPN